MIDFHRIMYFSELQSYISPIFGNYFFGSHVFDFQIFIFKNKIPYHGYSIHSNCCEAHSTRLIRLPVEVSIAL